MKLVPIGEFKWPAEGELFSVTCTNHPTAKYSTKNPWTRQLHFIEAAEGFGFGQECPCPFRDLAVVLPEES